MTSKAKEKMADYYKTALEHFNINEQVFNDKFSAREIRDYGFLVLRGKIDDNIFVETCLKYGVVIPTKPLQLEYDIQKNKSAGQAINLWISPDEFLHLVPLKNKDELLSQLSDKLSASFAAVVDNSGGYSFLRLSGRAITKIMAKVCAYDISTHNLPNTKVVSSFIGKAPAILFRDDNWHRTSKEESIERQQERKDSIFLLTRFSFADYVWRLLDDAANKYK